MGNYKNFDLVVYFIAGGVANATRDKLQTDIDFFKRYMRLDKVYLEPFRDGVFATEKQLRMCKEIFEANGIRAEGGITTSMPDIQGHAKKQRMFNTFCYNDPDMMNTLQQVCELNAKVFDAFIIDDFYFTNCTCDACRKGRDEYNTANGITDGSWQAYRTHLMYEASLKYVINPAKAVNPDCKITIKYPNWMESYQETGYDPASQKDIFDYIYTGTETRDPVNTDQHLPRYLSYSLMTYLEAMAPGRNGGGWFDPFDCRILDYYLEQAYLTAFSKPREMMMFCFQALVDSVNVPALGFMLDKLDSLLDKLGKPVGIPCYIPNASQGEDNVQDYLGMHGFPIVTTPLFEEDAPTMLLTASSAYDADIVDKLEKYIASGHKAIVTSGFVQATLDKGLARITSIRDRGRKATVKEFTAEASRFYNRWERAFGEKSVNIPVLEFRNNATWGAVCKGISEEEAYTLFALDTYGEGQMYTLVVPESFSDLKYYPNVIRDRMRKEFAVNGIYLTGNPMISLFAYDNDTFAIYPYVDADTRDSDIYVHIKNAASIVNVESGQVIEPLYFDKEEAVFCLRATVGKFAGYRIQRSC